MSDIKYTVYRLLEPAKPGDLASRTVDIFIVGLIVVNVIISLMETVTGLNEAFYKWFWWLEVASVGIFTVEYILRLWSCTAAGRTPLWGRLRYALHPLLLVDLVAILPFFLYFLGLDLRMARLLRLTRLFRIAKLVRYSRALRFIGEAVSRCKEELFLTLMMGLFALTFSATAIYYAESAQQPEVFSSIPASFWWAVTTLTAVGYGDTYPLTIFGKIVGGVVQVIGIIIFALPAGLLASAFIEQMQIRNAARLAHHAALDASTECPRCGAKCPRCEAEIDS